MELYIWRLIRIGFTLFRAYQVCMERRHDPEVLDKYITDLEEL